MGEKQIEVKQLNIRLPRDILKQLNLIAAEYEVSKEVFLTDIIRQHIKKIEKSRNDLKTSNK